MLSEEHGVVQEMLKTFAGSVKILPLSESTLHHSEHTTCFMTLHLGVSWTVRVGIHVIVQLCKQSVKNDIVCE